MLICIDSDIPLNWGRMNRSDWHASVGAMLIKVFAALGPLSPDLDCAWSRQPTTCGQSQLGLCSLLAAVSPTWSPAASLSELFCAGGSFADFLQTLCSSAHQYTSLPCVSRPLCSRCRQEWHSKSRSFMSCRRFTIACQEHALSNRPDAGHTSSTEKLPRLAQSVQCGSDGRMALLHSCLMMHQACHAIDCPVRLHQTQKV